MTVFIEGIATRFYRGIGPEMQYVQPLSRINLFIGANNAGKSIFLNLLTEQVQNWNSPKKPTRPSGTSIYRGGVSGEFEIFLGTQKKLVLENLKTGDRSKRVPNRNHSASLPFDDEIEKICTNLSKHGMLWTYREQGSNHVTLHPRPSSEEAKQWTQAWQGVWTLLTGSTNGSYEQHWFPQTIQKIADLSIRPIPKVSIIPAKRTLGDKGENFNDLSGKGLIDHLAGLQNPNWDQREKRTQFEKINKFLSTVIGKPAAELEIPSERDHILVHIDDKVLPLQSLGTGIHEVVLIAAFCTIFDNQIMCIEEPEIHLHPVLQRKLIDYITNETKNQYFIATHSSAFIDCAQASVFHVRNDGVQTSVSLVTSKADHKSALDELGFRPSDILHSNFVVWLEGPSDRIYVTHWLKSLAPDLQEGIHYTTMFYGGGLISHLSTSDDALSDFIKLKDLNRNMSIILDSDKSEEEAELKPHAQRIFDEMSGDGGMVWITSGREIENYIPGNDLQNALKKLHPVIYKKSAPTGKFDHAFYFYRDDPKNPSRSIMYKKGDKVGAAQLICSGDINLNIHDLKERVLELAEMIRTANGI